MRTYKYLAWNGEQMISPDYITRDGLAYWKENSIISNTNKIVQFTGLHDQNSAQLYADDIIEGHDGQKYRIYAMPGGFGIKAQPWASDLGGLSMSDELIMQPLVEAQVASYIMQSCRKIGSVLETPELLKL